MKQFSTVMLFALFLASCNDSDSIKEEGKKENNHAGHTMISSGADYCDSINSGLIAADTLKGSPHRTAMNTIAGTHVHIEYSSPGVKDRVIWGGLVAWDKVWVAGAHQATSIRFYKDVLIDGKTIPAGTYAFFAIPGKDKWTLLLNRNYDQHLADDYRESEDIIRLSVEPSKNATTQRLTYVVESVKEKQGVVNLMWENIKVGLPFKVI